MRASQPASYDEAMQSWHLVCYQEVLQVLADTSHFVPPRAKADAILASFQEASRQERWHHVIEMLVLQALAYQMVQQESEALASLVEVVRLDEPEGYVRRFVKVWERVDSTKVPEHCGKISL